MASWLAERAAAEGGCFRFDRFMELALYDPDHGYYRRQVQTVGAQGDFSTSATLNERLGRAIAAWAQAEAKTLGLRPLHLIELGGGDGSLARGLLRRTGWGVRYHLVEVSEGLRARQRQRLPSRRVQWHADVRDALHAAGGRALLFSNEFVDAFPCRRFERIASGWSELHFCLKDGRWREELGPAADLPDAGALAWFAPAGQRVEVHEAYRHWQAGAVDALRTGALLTVDYGGSVPEIYARRLGGTVRAYASHRRREGLEIYLQPGAQDLTADVSFDDLRRWGIALGGEEVWYGTQAEFLARFAPDRRATGASAFVADVAGAGGAFKVLHQRWKRNDG